MLCGVGCTSRWRARAKKFRTQKNKSGGQRGFTSGESKVCYLNLHFRRPPLRLFPRHRAQMAPLFSSARLRRPGVPELHGLLRQDRHLPTLVQRRPQERLARLSKLPWTSWPEKAWNAPGKSRPRSSCFTPSLSRLFSLRQGAYHCAHLCLWFLA